MVNRCRALHVFDTVCGVMMSLLRVWLVWRCALSFMVLECGGESKLSTPAALNSAGSRGQPRCTPDSIDRPRPRQREEQIDVTCGVFGDVPWSLHMSVTCCSSSKNMHAYASVVNPWICPDVPRRLQCAWLMLPTCVLDGSLVWRGA